MGGTESSRNGDYSMREDEQVGATMERPFGQITCPSVGQMCGPELSGYDRPVVQPIDVPRAPGPRQTPKLPLDLQKRASAINSGLFPNTFIGNSRMPASSSSGSVARTGSETAPPKPTATPAGTDGFVYRMRFFNFNMANSSGYTSVADLQGPGGRGHFLDALREPLADGRGVDIAFATLVETRLNMSEWVQEYMAQYKDSHLDCVLSQNARREGAQNTRSRVRSWMEGIAASYNGNLKSMLAFCSGSFKEDRSGGIFGRLTEARLAGLPVPNPKKAFMGRSIVSVNGEGIRLCFVGAHFPLAKLAAALEDPTADPLEGAKVALARTLRKVLRKASRRGLTDDRTAIFVQGDLNSRTVLRGTEVRDVLLELMRDDAIQAAIQHELALPPGRWREVPEHETAYDLPVTYKFLENVECSKQGAPVKGGPGGALTIGDVVATSRRERRSISLQDFSRARPKLETATTSNTFAVPMPSAAELYKRTLTNLGDDQLNRWGVVFKKNDFRAFRFPACADRVIYWAPDELADRMTWELPRGGYEVNHQQLGSDHRPVALEAVLHVAREPVRESPRLFSDQSVERLAISLEDSDGSEGDPLAMDGVGTSP